MSTEPPRAEAVSGAHQPYIPASQTIPEFTLKAVALGAGLGIAFALSSVYLGLKVGLTVSASIPIAVLAITLFRWLRIKATILENNIVQTTGSAGESIAAGVAFTLPSLLIMGFELELIRVLLVALLGGLIGVLMMIPLRQGLIVKEHGKLAYPEGTACADVLIVGERGGTAASTVFTGFFIGLGYAFLNLITKLWHEVATFPVEFGGRLKKGMLAFEVSPPMLGVGYIIGPKVASNMLAGGMLAFLVLIPLIAQFGGAEVAAKSAYALRNDYVLYIGAGAVATGGFIALARSLPTIINAFRRGMGNLKVDTKGGKAVEIPRTDRDISMRVVLGGSGLLAVAIFAAPVLQIDVLTAVLVVLFGFFFVTVSSRITGEIGSSSNPISGMTIATLLLTCGLFVLLGRTGVGFKAMALTTAALVCVAASNGGTISQDLKTGFLVGATPRYQQLSILVGVVTSAIVIGFTLLLLDSSVTTYQGVDYGTFTLPANVEGVKRTTETVKGPDGQSYGVAFVQNDSLKTPDGTLIPRGKYFVDAKGGLMFFVHPGVVGSYPYKLEKKTGTFPVLSKGADGTLYQGAKPAGRTDGRAIAPDKATYQVYVLDADHDKLARGRYLVAEDGRVAYRLDGELTPGVAEPGATEAPLPVAGQATAVEAALPATLSSGADGALLIGGAAVGQAEGTDLGLDRKPYTASNLTEVVGDLRPGYYLTTDTQIAFYSGRVGKYDAPKAQLFRLIIDGTLGGSLPWGLVLIGVFIAILLEMVRVSSLPFAVGLYLPISTSAAIFVGGAVRWLVDRKRKGESESEAEFSPGMLMASGLIAGGAILGVVQAILFTLEDQGMISMKALDLSRFLPDALAVNHAWYPMIMFLIMAGALYYVGVRRQKTKTPPTATVVTKKD